MGNSSKMLETIEEMLLEKDVELKQLTHLQWIEERRNGRTFSKREHLRALIYAQLSNNRRWMQVEKRLDEIDEIFFDYDRDRLMEASPDELSERILSIQCGNRAIRKQMEALHGNILKLERIEKEFGSLDHFVTSGTPLEIADLLAISIKYKLHMLGLPLAMEYLRNVGINTIKPDVHVCRILGKERLGYTEHVIAGEEEAAEIVRAIALETGFDESRIDALLWLFCSDDNGMICTKEPHCEQCKLYGGLCHYAKE